MNTMEGGVRVKSSSRYQFGCLQTKSFPSNFHIFQLFLDLKSENEDDMHEDGQKVHLVTHVSCLEIWGAKKSISARPS